MNGLIKYKINEGISRNIHHNKFYMITTKETYYAIHKIDQSISSESSSKHKKSDPPPPVSKPSMLSFIEKKHILQFQNYLEVNLKEGYTFNRNIVPYGNKGVLYSEKIPISSFFPPLIIETIKSSDLELMCILNYFDMLIITSIKKQEDNSITIYGYEHIIRERPNRELIEYKLRLLM
jgi:hypothetical protein